MTASSPCHFRRRRAACTLGSLAAGCFLSGTAFAWPFVQHTGGLHEVSDLRQHLAIQTDTDRPFEVFGGGDGYLQMSAAPTGGLLRQEVDLPAPDKDPYAANSTAVGFSFGRGDAGDIDGDGDTDIVYSANLTYNNSREPANVRVVVCFNNGNDTWTRGWQLKATSSAVAFSPEVKLADLDRDGDLDLIETQNGVRVRWNPGNGDFSGTPVSLFSGYKQVPELEVADFDGNGWPDIAVFGDVAGLDPDIPLSLTGRLTMLSNQGGTFTAATVITLPTSRDFEGTATADVNEDGKPDLVVTRSRYTGGQDLHWHRNTGSGFAAPVLLEEFPDLLPVFEIGDLDEDGHLDILLSTCLGEARWRRGTGAGTFHASAVIKASSSPAAPSGIGAGDMDGDGDLDLRIEGALLENLAPHKGSDARVLPFSGINPSATVDLTVGDMNNDGKEDLIAADGGAQRIRWYAGTGSGLEVPAPLSTGNLTPLGVAAGDFNGDGWTDIAWTTNGLMSQALSTNGSGFSWNITGAANMAGITAIEPRDMDRDGDTDILSISPSAGVLRIHANNGTATSWLPQNVETGISGLGAMTTGELTPGGRPEIVILSGNAVSAFQHHPINGWSPSSIGTTSGSTGSRAVITADITDAKPGLETVFAFNSNEIKYDHGSSSPVTLMTTTHPVKQLAAVDWNADGFTDLLVATTNGVILFQNTRNAAGLPFTGSGIPLITGMSIQDLVTMKLDADCYRDAVAVDSTGQLHLIYNRSGAVRVSPASPGTSSVFPGDSGNATFLNANYENTSGYTQAAAAAPAIMRIQFLRSIVNGSQDTPGSYLTPTEVSELVESVSVTRGGAPLHTAPANTLFGGMTLTLPTDVRQSLALLWSSPNLSGVQIAVKLKPTAASASVQRFYVEYFPADSHWLPLDAAGTSGPLPLRLSGATESVRTLFVVDTPSAMDHWRMLYFNTYHATGNAANEADPDGDGFSNIMEYITGRSPVAASGISGSTPVVELTSQGNSYPVLATLRLLENYDPKVRLTLQQSTTLGQWTTVSTRLGTGAWTGTQPAAFPLQGGRTRFVFSTAGVPSVQPRYFLRLVADELP